jgi:hypothetical protein
VHTYVLVALSSRLVSTLGVLFDMKCRMKQLHYLGGPLYSVYLVAASKVACNL